MESISSLETKRANLVRSAQNIVDKALREGRAMYPGEDADVTSIEGKLNDIDRTLGRANIFGRNGGEAGMTFVRAVLTLAGESGNLQGALRIANARRDHEVVRALSAAIGTSGGYAVPTAYSGEIAAALRPLVSVRRLNPTTLPMPKGNLTWPRLSTGGSATFMGENTTVPLSQAQSFAELRLTAKKLAAIIPISNDFVRFARPDGEVIVREDIIAAVSAAEDAAFITGNGTEFTPRGLLNWVKSNNTITANSTVTLANVDADLSALESALTGANVVMARPGWLFAPQTLQFLKNLRGSGGDKAYPELNAGMLRGYPYATSTNVPINLGSGNNQSVVILADFADVVIGDASFVIDAGTQSTYVDVNGNTISAFQNDQTVVRIISQSDLGMKRQESVAALVDVSWIPAAS